MKFRRKSMMVLCAIALSLGVAVAAFAFWTQGGSGTGSASTGTTANITVNQTSTVADLYPGGPSGALSGTFTNPNSGPVNIASVTAVVTGVTPAQVDVTKPACTTGDFAVSGTSGPYTVLADDTTTWSGLAVSLTNGAANQDNCKNVTLTLTYTAS